MRRAPRRRLNSEFKTLILQGRRPSWVLAQLAGWRHQSGFSSVLHTNQVRATPLIVERLQRVADAVDFPRDQIFVDEPAEAVGA